MMGFRVIAWLAALVVLAGCVEQSIGYNPTIGESLTLANSGEPPAVRGDNRPQNTPLVTKLCDRPNFGGYTEYSRGHFRIQPESAGSSKIYISHDQREIIISTLEIETRIDCYLSVKFSQKIVLSPIAQTQWETFDTEQTMFNQGLNRCLAMGSVADRLYSDVGDYFSTYYNLYLEIGDGFIGCGRMVQNYSLGFFVKSASTQWKVAVVLDQFFINEVNL